MFAMVVFCSWSGAGQASGRGQISSHGNSHRRRETDMFSSCPSLRTSVCSRLCRAVCHSVCRCAVVFNQRPLRSRGRPWMDRGVTDWWLVRARCHYSTTLSVYRSRFEALPSIGSAIFAAHTVKRSNNATDNGHIYARGFADDCYGLGCDL